MNENNESTISRRDFLKDTGKVTAASALALAGSIPAVHAQGSSLIQVAFVGCGGRGGGEGFGVGIRRVLSTEY